MPAGSRKGRVLSSDKSSMVTGNNLSCASPTTSIRKQILNKEAHNTMAQKNFEAFRLFGID